MRVAAVAAAVHLQTSRRRAIDVHAHYFPRTFLDDLRANGAAPGFDIDFATPDAPVLVQGPVRTTLDATYWDLDKRIRRMDAQGVEVHALSLTLPMVHWAPKTRGAALAKMVNESIIES